MADKSLLLELAGVSKRYGADGGSRVVLDGVDLQVAPGESIAVVGPSGSGKSTLLNIIGALDRPTGGRVRLEGQDLSALGDEALARLRNRRVGFVFQLHHLLPQCTVLENVLVPTLAPGGPPDPRDLTRARELLDSVGLAGRLDDFPGRLSGGERQRVAVVRALINQPALLLADEPTGSLDRASAEALAGLLVELNARRGLTLIVVTHSLALAGRMGRVLELRDGRLLPPRGRQ